MYDSVLALVLSDHNPRFACQTLPLDEGFFLTGLTSEHVCIPWDESAPFIQRMAGPI